MSYSDVVDRQETTTIEEKPVKNDWTFIRNNNGKIEFLNLKKINHEETDEQYRLRYNYYRNKMIENWNNYRDSINELLGDNSPYINYKKEIEDMVNEELEIQAKIDAFNNGEEYDDDDYLSDEERNYHLVY